MFKKELQSKLQKIFGMQKVTFDEPSEQYEQDVLFIEIANSNPRIFGKKQTARVIGSVAVFSKDKALPYGFFAKRIAKASQEDKAGLVFNNLDTDVSDSQARIVNIHERRCGFVFLYSAQYDPNQGKMNKINFGECNDE